MLQLLLLKRNPILDTQGRKALVESSVLFSYESLDVGIQCVKEMTGTLRPASSKGSITHPCSGANLTNSITTTALDEILIEFNSTLHL
jgi:hypothetical protein